jgi:ESCRT-II complex subunit VPS22
LTDFAKRHQHEIQADPAIRQKFLQMCAPLGVDPLQQAHHKKTSFWSFLEMGDLYYSLAVQVAEVCWATRSRNGGIISVAEVQKLLGQRTTKFNMSSSISTSTTSSSSKRNSKTKKNRYSFEDIQIAITKLSTLGNGFRMVTVGSIPMIVSVPTELDQDHTQVMTLAQDSKGCVTVEQVMTSTQWNRDRAERALHLLLGEGMAWLDEYRGESFYWFPR